MADDANGSHPRCTHCGSELPPHALACPVCGTLVHAERLRQLASRAQSAETAGALGLAREQWETALRFLPNASQQHTVITARVADLARRLDATGPAPADGTSPHAKADERAWWQRGLAAVVAGALLVVGKLKFLLLGLTKASTFVSMFAFFAVYWSIYGWPLALGIAGSIYIHEMGHVAMLKRLGIASGAPLFIPGVGALVMLKQRVDDPIADAQIGLAGPVWGLGAGLSAFAVHAATGKPIWLAIAQLTGFLNLFNLIPVWQLDGSRGFHALSRVERWIVVAAVGLTLYLTGQKILFLVGGVAVWRAIQREVGPGGRRVLATFLVLVGALGWLARAVG